MTVTSPGTGRSSSRGRLAAAWRSGPLSGPGFRLLAAGQFASTIGDYCYVVALPRLTSANAVYTGLVQIGSVVGPGPGTPRGRPGSR